MSTGAGADAAYWHALHVRSRCEKSVQAQLTAKHCEAFLPLYKTRHKWADRYRVVALPLFPGYVFCRFPPSQRSLVVATSGVLELVQVGRIPAAIDPSEIEAIRAAVESPLALEPYAGLIRGQNVTMQGGPLSGLAGRLLAVRKNLRLVLSVELLHRSVLVEIEREWVMENTQIPFRVAGSVPGQHSVP